MSEQAKPSKRQSMEQARAATAWQMAKGQKEEYGGRVSAFAPDVLSNGLLQTIAVYKAGKGDEALVVEQIQKWLFDQKSGMNWGNRDEKTLIERLCKCEQDTYRRAETEALAFIVWLKRFAKGE